MISYQTNPDAQTAVAENGLSVTTFGWDTAYLARYSTVNHAIKKQKSYPQSFDFSDPSGIRIQGKWSAWLLSPGGSGKEVQMTCTIEEGDAILQGSQSLQDTSVIIQVNLKKVAAAAFQSVDTIQAGSGDPTALVIRDQETSGRKAVTVIDVQTQLTGILGAAIESVFVNYFNANISEFKHVFAVMNINAVADKKGFQWLKPTAFDYAVSSPEDPTLENSVFGLIAMVQNRPIDPLLQPMVDFTPLIHQPEGANSAFVISEEMVVKNMLLRGAITTIQGSKASDFKISDDGRSVVNVKPLLWGNFQTSDELTISPIIDPGNFYLKAERERVTLEITKAKYEALPGVFVHMNLLQHFAFKTKQLPNGNFVFVPDIKGFGEPRINASVSLSETLQILELVGEILGVIAALMGGLTAIAKKFGGTAEVSPNVEENTAEISFDADSMEAIASENPAEMEAANQESAESVDEGAAQPNNANQVQRGGVLNSAKFKLATAIIAGAAGVIEGGLEYAKELASGEFEDIPPFDDFVSNCLSSSVWPNTKDYKLKSAGFKDALVLNIALDEQV